MENNPEFTSEIQNNEEEVFVLLKPDAVSEGLSQKILQRFTDDGFEIVAMKMQDLTLDQAEVHCPDDIAHLMRMGRKEDPSADDEEALKIGKIIRQYNIDFLTSGSVIAVLLKGNIQRARELAGESDPSKAAKKTIRRDFSKDSFSATKGKRTVHNCIHVADSKETVIIEKENLL